MLLSVFVVPLAASSDTCLEHRQRPLSRSVPQTMFLSDLKSRLIAVRQALGLGLVVGLVYAMSKLAPSPSDTVGQHHARTISARKVGASASAAAAASHVSLQTCLLYVSSSRQ